MYRQIDTITITLNTISNDTDGNPASVTNSININCYVDFTTTNNLKLIKDGETVITKGKIFITDKTEIDKITFDFDEVTFNNIKYNVLKRQNGINHIEILI